MISVVVTTAPRTVGYLEATLASLHDAGFPAIELVEDAALEGVNVTYKRALRVMLESTNSPYILVCQDDILVAKGLADWLESMDWPADPMEVGCLSLYCAQPLAQDDTGWWEFPLQPTRLMKQPWTKVYGALAMLWPRASAERFVHDPPAFVGKAKVDQLIGKWCMDTGRRLFLHSPSLVEHIGAVSTFGGTGSLTPSRIAGQWCQDVRTLGSGREFLGRTAQLETAAQPAGHL